MKNFQTNQNLILKLFFWGALIVPFKLFGAELGGLEISAAGDLLFEHGWKEAPSDRKLRLRSAELMFRGPTDHLFEGVLSFAAHEYRGEFNLGVHEAFVQSSRAIPRTQFKLGQFFLGVGRLNAIHAHDWPFIQAPLLQERFFDREGIIDSGLEVSLLLPLPVFAELSLGLTSGWRITHSHGDPGEKPKVPTHYAKLEFSHDLPSAGALLWGLSGLGRKDADSQWWILSGAHAVAKWQRLQVQRLLLQAELWNRQLRPASGEMQNELGAYLFSKVGWTAQWATGLRLDLFRNLNLRDFNGDSVGNWEAALSPELEWRASEMLFFRTGYSYKRSHVSSQPTSHEHLVSLQSVFVLGAHPAHDF